MFFELTGERWIGDIMPVNEPVGAVVYSMDTSNVDAVYVGGPARKQAGQLVGGPGSHRGASHHLAPVPR
jgi:hypothetical protein